MIRAPKRHCLIQSLLTHLALIILIGHGLAVNAYLSVLVNIPLFYRNVLEIDKLYVLFDALILFEIIVE